MRLFLNDKKALVEITSFVLLTLLIVIASSSAYIYSNKLIDKTISKNDRDNAENYIKLIKEKIDLISNFEDATSSININFKKGELNFKDNQVSYQSLERYYGETICFDDICYEEVEGFEKIYFNLSSPYIFTQNISMDSNLNKITFKNIKNESKIQVIIK